MYNYILLILVIINSLNCSDIVVNIDTSMNGLFTSICQRQIIKQIFLHVLQFIKLFWVSNSYPWFIVCICLSTWEKLYFNVSHVGRKWGKLQSRCTSLKTDGGHYVPLLPTWGRANGFYRLGSVSRHQDPVYYRHCLWHNRYQYISVSKNERFWFDYL